MRQRALGLLTRVQRNDGAIPQSQHAIIPSTAPFRLLAFGDPQLEGDTSLPTLEVFPLSSLKELWSTARDGDTRSLLRFAFTCVQNTLIKDVPRALSSYRKRLDLIGNDYYLAHIYRTLHWYTKPTHVTVLGDLLGSQWIGNKEFDRRNERFWKRVFAGARSVPEETMQGSEAIEELGENTSWNDRVIAIAGNHDIGYAGDIDEARIERFEKAFGKVNWSITFTLPGALNETATTETGAVTWPGKPALRLINLNSMNLDTPALASDLQLSTYGFMNDMIMSGKPVEDRTHATILLTHIPLFKDEGV
ncbi:hypothetical protein LTS18_005237, partial [Coniosporium uncinatum]